MTEKFTSFLLVKRGLKTDLAFLLEGEVRTAPRPNLDYEAIYPILKKHAGKDGIDIDVIIAKAIEAGVVVDASGDKSRLKQQLKTKGNAHGFSLVPDIVIEIRDEFAVIEKAPLAFRRRRRAVIANDIQYEFHPAFVQFAKPHLQIRVARGLCHFGQSFDQLTLGAVKIFELVDKNFLKRLDFRHAKPSHAAGHNPRQGHFTSE